MCCTFGLWRPDESDAQPQAARTELGPSAPLTDSPPGMQGTAGQQACIRKGPGGELAFTCPAAAPAAPLQLTLK